MTTQMTEAPVTTQMTEAPVTTEVPVSTDDGDHDRFSHYVPKPELERAILDGIPARALCGKLWLPTKDPDKYPVCPECKEKWEALNDG